MTSSVNGWPVLDNRTTGRLPRLRKWIIPTAGDRAADRHLYLRDGSAGFLLAHLALWFHESVERLNTGTWDEWGWASRPIRGGTAISNHASGTAMDLNATQHPMGVPVARTFTPAQVRDIRRRLKLYGGRIDWGGEWSRPDGMHFELAPGTELPGVEHRARQLIDSPRGERVLAVNPGALAIIKR